MLRPRVIPVLLVHQGGLVKTVAFENPKYVGDPINAVKIFNEKEADELIVLDIDATVKGVEADYGLIANLAAECRMPLCYGGGVRTAEQAKRIVGLGVEKVAVSAAAVEDPLLVGRMAQLVGRQSVVVVIDVRSESARGRVVCTRNGKRIHQVGLLEFAKKVAEAGAGEIVINSVDRDGKMNGYDLALAREMKETVSVPLTMIGGAGSLDDMAALFRTCGVVGAGAGSLFVFKGTYRAVLINYPVVAKKDALLASVGGAHGQGL